MGCNICEVRIDSVEDWLWLKSNYCIDRISVSNPEVCSELLRDIGESLTSVHVKPLNQKCLLKLIESSNESLSGKLSTYVRSLDMLRCPTSLCKHSSIITIMQWMIFKWL